VKRALAGMHSTADRSQYRFPTYMPLSQVHHMDVVTDACAVRCGVVPPKHAQALPLSKYDLPREQQQLIRKCGWREIKKNYTCSRKVR